MPNRLAGETSPYLLQHQDNPVDWYPWGEEAFARAREEDRPILLSVGYSSCHWCHVMAHESFEDPEIAALMNQWFVCVKVDREERPDVDAIYMTATQALTGQGGWPMTVFLTPDLVPFYAGTYYPPRDSGGRVGFPRLLASIHQAWQDDRDGIQESARQIAEHLRGIEARLVPAAGIPTHADAGRALARLQPIFDQVWGGFGAAPKFPSPSNYEALLAAAARLPGQDPADPRTPLGMVALTLDRMAAGGMADQLGGGFARYAVDARWLIPHFEKMLYDNAQLARLYLHGWQITGQAAWRDVVTATLDYLVRDMRHPAGAFFSAQDADSEGVEGLYYTWTPAEIRAVLGEEAPFALDAWGVTDEGNFQDPHHPEIGRRSVLHRWTDLAEAGARHGLDPDTARRTLERCRQRLLEARYQRVPPGLDDKVLASWNGLALAAFAEAGRVLRRPDYLDIALASARFLRDRLWDPERRALLHTWKDGQARIDGMLEDYTFCGLGLVELFAATGDRAWLDWARELLEIAIGQFHDPAAGGFYDAAAAPDLIVRQKPTFDGPTPSGNAAAGLLAWWLGRYYGDERYLALADEVLRLMAERMIGVPNGFGAAWLLAELRLAPEREVAIVGPDALRAPLEAALARVWVPGLVIAPAREPGGLPVLQDRVPPPPAAAAAWLCEARVCQLPATTPDQLATQLAALQPSA